MQSEIARCLEDNQLKEFKENVEAAEEVGYDLNTQYGKEVNNCMYIKLYRTSFTVQLSTVQCPPMSIQGLLTLHPCHTVIFCPKCLQILLRY